ncbi:hypothetical protein BJ165DRAFT_627771 [Panaeolus papilionaceus]|nr:hypothetical protein BJ165DRAFT_627771 [Panaeolus papilionaceus]
MSDNRTLDLLFRKERNFDTVPKSASRAARLEYLNADLIRRFANENGENGAENLEAHLIENTKVTVDFTPLSTKNKRESMNANWCSYLKHTARHLAESVYWHYETVVKHGPGLLHYLSLLAKPRAKYDTQLRSKTVDGWASTFINVVISNTVHPDGEKAGYAALLDGGLVKDLDNKKKTCTGPSSFCNSLLFYSSLS